MKLIGISGAAGSGKSTMANQMVTWHGYTRLRFADPIKRMTMVLLVETGASHSAAVEMVDGMCKNDAIPQLGGKTPRDLMQTLGTEWGRELISPDIWLSVMRCQLDAHRDKMVVIDDVRFENEARMIRERGGKVIGVVGRGGLPSHHASENGVSPDVTFHNRPGITLDEMSGWLRHVLAHL
jgi:hypothetical protein